MLNAQEWLENQEEYNTQGKRDKIRILDISRKNLEGSLDLSDFVNLEELNCSNNQLSSLNVSGCLALTELNCCNNPLNNLNCQSNSKLRILNISDTNINRGLEYFPDSLTNFYCYNTKLEKELKKHKKIQERGSSSDYITLLQRWKKANPKLIARLQTELLNIKISPSSSASSFFTGDLLFTNLSFSGLEQLTENSASREKEIQALTGQLIRAQTIKQEIGQYYENLRQEWLKQKALINQLQNKQVDFINLKNEWEALAQSKAQGEEENQAITQTLANQQTNHERKFAIIESQLANLENSCQTEQTKVQQLTQENQRLSQTKAQQIQEINQLQTKVANLQGQVESIQLQSSTTEGRLSGLFINQQVELEATRNKYIQELEEKQDKLNTLKEALENQKAVGTTETTNLKQEIERLTTELTYSQETAQQELQEEITTLQTVLAEKEKKIKLAANSANQNLLEQLEKEKEELKAELTFKEKELTELKQFIITRLIQERKDELTKMEEEIEKGNYKLVKSLRQKQADLTKLEIELENMQRDSHSKSNRQSWTNNELWNQIVTEFRTKIVTEQIQEQQAHIIQLTTFPGSNN